MKRIYYFSIAICFVIGLLLVGGLFFHSRERDLHIHSFDRTIMPVITEPSKIQHIRFNSYYLAGISGKRILLGNYTAPLHLLQIDTAFTDTISVELHLEDSEKLSATARLKIEDSLFYIIDGSIPVIFRGRIGEWNAERFMYDSVFFRTAIPVLANSFAFLAIGKAQENVLGILRNESPHVTVFDTYLEKQIDGIFCTDGQLLRSRDPDYIVYVYRFRNDYLLLNNNMDIIAKLKTIDPIDRVRIKPYKVSSDNSIMLASPSNYVNQNASVYKGYLFVHSNIRARNDKAKDFLGAATIDVYDLQKPGYAYSFYLPSFQGKKPKDFIVLRNMIVALYDRHVIKYSLRLMANEKSL